MSTPLDGPQRQYFTAFEDETRYHSDNEGTVVGDGNGHSQGNDTRPGQLDPNDLYERNNLLNVDTAQDPSKSDVGLPSPSHTREQQSRLDDDLEMLRAERIVTNGGNLKPDMSRDKSISRSMYRSRSHRSDPVDDFDISTNPLHEKAAVYRPPEHPSTNFAKVLKKVHNSSFLIRYFTYIVPLVVVILVPLLLGALVFKKANVGGVYLLWFSVWLEIVWLTLWAGRILAKALPWPIGLISSIFTNNSKKWRDLGKQLEVPATVFFWWLAIEISFLPTMKNHHVDGNKSTRPWEITMNKIIVSVFVGTVLNFIEKIIIQLIAISFHLRTYADRIEINKFQIGSLVKLYTYSKEKIQMDDSDFEQPDTQPGSGARTPMAYVNKAQKGAREAMTKVGDVAGKVAGDFTGKQVVQSNHPHQVVLMLLSTTSGSQVLARRLYRTFAREDTETVVSEDLKNAFENDEEADAAFQMFDKDLNGDISMEELEAVCVEIGRERKSITASLKDLDSVVSKLDDVLFFVVVVITLLVLLSLISASAAGVLTSAGSTVLALSWLFAATAQEFLQSVVFVFVKHPFDVGDRVSIYGNTGANMKGDDYFVKEIALLYTEFKKMEGQVVQAPNSYLNTLFILNMRRSGGLAEAIPVVIKFGTTLDQIEGLRTRLLDFVTAEKREYQNKILTELREVTEAHSLTLNIVFFYKSNWQNELLRLQRRNKFICAMMISMQEVGMEGPRMRIAGQKPDTPFYMNNGPFGTDNSQAPSDPADNPNGGGSNNPQPSLRSHTGSILSTSNTRRRGESLTAMSKRVDFSLGMRGMAAADMMGDIHEENVNRPRIPTSPPPPASPSASRFRRRTSNSTTNEQSPYLGRTSSRDTSSGPFPSFDNAAGHPLGRASTDSQSRQQHPLHQYASIHRNRFFGRGSTSAAGRSSSDAQRQADLEAGMGLHDIPEAPTPAAMSTRNGVSGGAKYMDPRSGLVSPQAVQMGPVAPAPSGVGTAAPATAVGAHGEMLAGQRGSDGRVVGSDVGASGSRGGEELELRRLG